MISKFKYLSVFDYRDFVCIADSGEPVCDDKYGFALHQTIQPLLDQLFCAGIDGRGRFIENQYRTFGKHCAGNVQELALTLAEAVAIRSEHCFKTIRKSVNKIIGIGGPRRFDTFFIGGVQTSVPDVFQNRTCEQMRILKNYGHTMAQITFADISNIDAVIGDGAVLNVIKAAHKIGERSFACARRTDQRDFLARIGL